MGRRKKQAEAAAAPDASATETISKMEAVRRALDEGKESPKEGVAFIQERFGLRMTTNHFSNYKGAIRGRKGKGKKRGRKPGRKPNAAPPELLVATVIDLGDGGDEGGIALGDVEAVLGLVRRYGARVVQRLVELVG